MSTIHWVSQVNLLVSLFLRAMAGKIVDLTKGGDWVAGGSVVGGLYRYDDHSSRREVMFIFSGRVQMR